MHTTPRTRNRTRTAAVLAAALSAVAAGLALAPAHAGTGDAGRDGFGHQDGTTDSWTSSGQPRSRIPLPDGFQPEGIETGPRRTAYVGSLVDGDVWTLDLRTGTGRLLSEGPGTPATGLELDRGLLFVAGGSGGDARVLDARTGAVLATWRLAPEGAASFVNDVVVTRDAVWFTESLDSVLYRVPLDRRPGFAHHDLAHGVPQEPAVERVELTGDWEQGEGLNANGIETTPSGRALLVVNSSNGLLHRVTHDGVARQVALGGTVLTNGDGLLREGHTLYAVQNRLDQVAVVRLLRDGHRGELRTTITSPEFDVPTTVARSGGDLYLPNARFGTTPTPTTEYWVTGVEG